MDRYTVGSDAAGLTQGYYDTKQLPIYKYLHGPNAPKYAILDDFFQAAFGGSFLNHQWLIAAATPVYPGTPDPTLHSIIDADGFPANYPPLHPTTGLRDAVLTVACNPDGTPPAPARVCGNYAVNTMQPTSQPRGAFGAELPTQHGTTIGDELTAANLPWAWYAGGWDNADRQQRGRGLDERPGAGLQRPERAPRLHVAGLPGCAVPVPPPAVQLLRQLRGRRARPLAPEGRGRLHERRRRRAAARRQLRQAGRRGERAPRLRQPAGRQRPPRRPAEGHRVRPAGGLDDGDRDLRRVRRAVGPREAADAEEA